MTVRYNLGQHMSDWPEPFLNLYRTIPRGFYKFDRCNEVLAEEPYRARLFKHGNRYQEYWWLEFPTQEDFMAFIMKWS